MRPIVPITFAAAAAAVGAWYLPDPTQRALTWTALGLGYLGLSAWGVSSLRSGLFVRARCAGDPARKQVALTYDDGPDPASTPALLDLLAERGVRATFFCVGERARAHPELVRRMHAEGHGVQNHSDTHSALTNFYGRARLSAELAACQATLAELTGTLPRFYRPPMGLVNHAVPAASRVANLEVVGWQVRSLDTSARSVDAVAQRVLKRVRPGGIVLLHDGGLPAERVVAITSALLDGLAGRGLDVAPLRELLGEG